jgi:hypothetical protein
MSNFPIRIPNSVIHFALRGRLESDFELLAVSENCPVGLYNAMPINSAGNLCGRLARVWFNLLRHDCNWAYSNYVPKIISSEDSTSNAPQTAKIPVSNDEFPKFHPESRLQFAWRAYSNQSLRKRVQRQLDRQKVDICNAILARDELSLANALGPVILECEGYSLLS